MVRYFSEGRMENSRTPSKKISRHVNYFIKTSIPWENENIYSNFIYYTFIGTVTEEDNSDQEIEMTIAMVSDSQPHSDEQLLGYTNLGSNEDEDEQPILRDEKQSNIFFMSE